MLANVAGGISPRWWRAAPAGSFARWDAFDHLDGLLRWINGPADTKPSELRELLEDARPHVPTTVYGAAVTFADTMEAVARQ